MHAHAARVLVDVSHRSIMKTHLLFCFWVLLAASLMDNADGQVVSCFAGERCTGVRTNGSLNFDDCCLSLSSQSFLTSSGDCCECSGAKVEFGEVNYIVDEGTNIIGLELVRYSDSSSELVVSITLKDGTARGGFDYGFFPEREVTFTLVFLVNETSMQFGVPIKDDNIVEATETFTASLSLPSEEAIQRLGYDTNPNPANLQIDSHGITTISIIDNDFVNITVSPEFVERRENEVDQTIEFVVRKSGLTERAVEVIAFTRNSSLTAVDGQDYLGFTETLLRFEPSEEELQLTVDLMDDSVVEFTEEFQVVLLPGDGETGVKFPRGQQSTVQILDDNDFVELLFMPLEYTVREEEGRLPLSILQVGESERPILFSVAYNETTTTATSGLDFNLTEATMSTRVSFLRLLGPGETLNIYPLQAFQDGRYELDEIIQLQLLPAEEETALVTGDPATVTLVDSDEVSIGFMDSAIVVSEPTNFTVSVVLFQNNLDPGSEISLNLMGRDGVATVGEDYVFSIDPAIFVYTPDGGSVLSINVEIIDDKVFEGREDFSLILDSPQPRVVFNPQETSIAITDNEDLLIDFDMAVYEVNETDQFLLVEVELTSMIERDIQLLLVSRDGGATGGRDYEAVSQVLTLRPDSRIARTTVSLLDDDLNEGLEEFILQLVLTDEQLGMPDILRESTVRIFDDEVTFVQFSSESYTVSESDRFVVLVINKTGVTQEDVPVIVNLMDGTARAGDNFDYGPFNSPSLSVMARLLSDETAIPFGVVIREDNRVEYEESFTAVLSLPPRNGSNIRLGAISMATVFIRDNDMINVTISPESRQMDESDTTVVFNVSRNDDVILDRNVSVKVSTESTTAGGGDFKADDSILTFTETGPRSFLYQVDIFDDVIAERSEELFVRLSATTPGEKGVVFHRNAAQFSIIDNDISMVRFTQNLFEAEEMDGEVEICLTKDLATASAFTVTLTPQETAPNPPETFLARAGIDFAPDDVLVTFAPDDQAACGKIAILNDQQVGESREVFAVLLSLPVDIPYIALGSPDTVNVIVTDTPDVVFGFERTELTIGEAAGSVDVCVVAFNPGNSDALEATINFNIRAQQGTADSNDYQITGSVNGTLSNTTREACFSVQIFDDMLFESEIETFSLLIESFDVISQREDSRMLRVATSTSQITIMITDNDRDIVIGFEEPEFSVEELDTSIELCVAVMRPTTREELNAVINITVATVSGSAGPSDYRPISAVNRDTVLMFNNSTRRACFRMTILDDMLFEDLEFFTVQLTPRIISIGTSQAVSLSPSVATITIIDDELPLMVGFEDGSLSRMVQETVGNVSLCVRVFGEVELATAFGVNVDIGGGGTADAQVDFALERDLTLTFDSLSQRQCFNVRIIADQDDGEPEEFFNLVLSLIQFLPGLSVDPDRDTALITILPISTLPPPIVGNDTVIGDPLFTVPLNMEDGLNLLPALAKRLNGLPNLCYEIHGEHDRYFSLVSDTCATVNAYYNASSSPDLRGWNVISTIGVQAVDRLEQCVNIEVGVENGCMPIISVDGMNSVVTPRYQSAGISVSKHQNKVRVSIPNCQNMQLVMWITCQSVSGFPMIRYDITRGVNLRPTSHGLIGQFWNVPVSVTRYTYTGSQTIDYLDLDSLYAVTVSSPSEGAQERTFIAELYTYTWELRNEVCFYAGNTQGGRLLEITDKEFNDPVIEGSYEDYVVGGLFEHNFAYSQFSASMC